MQQAEFDRVADEYEQQHAKSLRLSGERPSYFARQKVQEVARTLEGESAIVSTVLDFGGGIGNSVPHLRTLLAPAEVTCLDVSRRSLAIAEQRFPGQANYQQFDGQRIPANDGTYNLTFAACVFHHIDPSSRTGLLSELHRVTTPGGWLFLFEHNPLNVLTRHAVEQCPFDANAVLLRSGEAAQRVRDAGYRNVRTRYTLFFPRALRALRFLEPQLAWLPLGAQYCVVGRR